MRVSDFGRRFKMGATVRKRRKAVVAQEDCVACGCCVKVCPLSAIRVVKGIAAQVDTEKCVGCGKCARECPATVITIQEAAV
jgi:Pyruvate/2-oxoacid:ferredoxin oxidoreductase delta subunit